MIQSQKFGIITMIAALLLVVSAVSTTITTTPYSVFAAKYGDSNAQTSAANNDCPADLASIIIGVQQQAGANCLNDINMVQDSDGAAMSSTPFNAAPSQALDLELEFGDGDGTPPPPPPTDTDGDGVPDESDNCPDVSNPNQADSDGDGIGDVCDTSSTDTDGDGIPDEMDNCPEVVNDDQTDTDGDGAGDVCDSDIDNDTVPNDVDNCPTTPNPDQTDTDSNGIGDACDEITPSEEICGDGIDNDLDGLIDENCDLCDGIDNDGDGLIDEDCPTEPRTCEECLEPLISEQSGLAQRLATDLTGGAFTSDADAIAAICLGLETGTIGIEDLAEALSGLTPNLDLVGQIEACLELVLGV